MVEIITSDDILGKEALDSEGDIIGVVMKLHIDKKEKKILGITIDQGFMKPDLYAGIEYIKNFGVDTIFLNKIPPDKFKGAEVITHKGISVGIVTDVLTKSYNLKRLVVSKSSFSKDKFEIPLKHIEELGVKIILKKSWKPEKKKKEIKNNN
jgi:sporulation protein YlmC with PRC-barrel domain